LLTFTGRSGGKVKKDGEVSQNENVKKRGGGGEHLLDRGPR